MERRQNISRLRTAIGIWVLLSGAAGAGALSVKDTVVFDMQNMGSLARKNYYLVSPGNIYDATRGFGWLKREGYPYDRPGDYPLGELVRDGITVQDNTFRVDLENGDYTVTALIGDMYP